MRHLNVHSNKMLRAAFDSAGNGDIIRIYPAADYLVTPAQPLPATMGAYGGAPLVLDGLADVLVEGIGNPVIRADSHGSIIARRNCVNCHVKGLILRGPGYIRTEESQFADYYYSPIIYAHSPFCDTTHCVITDFGDQGIAELHLGEPSDSHHCRIAYNVLRRGGNLAHKPGADGAAIGWGGSDSDIDHNVIDGWLRGIEIENSYPTETSRIRITHNRITGSLWQGFVSFVTHGKGELFADNEVAYNYISGLGKPNPQFPMWGKCEHLITLTGGTRWNVHHNVLGPANDWSAIEALAVMGNLIDCEFNDNTIFATGRTGIWSAPQNGLVNSGHRIRGNRISTLNGPGITLQGHGWIGTDNVIHAGGRDPQGNLWPPTVVTS